MESVQQSVFHFTNSGYSDDATQLYLARERFSAATPGRYRCAHVCLVAAAAQTQPQPN